MSDSIFTRIIKGEIPAHKVYEDDKTISFLPLHPIAKAHVLVVPKIQVDHFEELPEADYQALWQTVHKVAKRMKEVIPSKRVGVQVIGLDVPHAHVHVVAFDTIEQFRENEANDQPIDDEALAQMAKKLAF